MSYKPSVLVVDLGLRKSVVVLASTVPINDHAPGAVPEYGAR